MNYSDFINKEVINKNNQRGLVLSFDATHIVIKYDNEEKTYNPDIALKNQFLKFIDENLNNECQKHILNKEIIEKEKQAVAEKNQKHAERLYREVDKRFAVIYEKNRVMKKLFGSDYYYRPYEDFVKRYKHSITEWKPRPYYYYN